MSEPMAPQTPNRPAPGAASMLGYIDDNAQSAQLPPGLSEADARRLYEGLVGIRVYDERALKLQRSGRIGFCVTSFGEEATQIGTAAAMAAQDYLFPSYRQYGVAMFRGMPLAKLAAHLFGNDDDTAKGRQMPAHYTSREHRFVSLSSVIGTQIIHAVGCAMAAKIQGDPVIAGTYFGDGATSSNDFHSALNFAGVFKAPVLFFLVNNQYAISLPVSRQTAMPELYRKAEGYGVPGLRVDGNDVVAVYLATREAASRARNGEGPTLLELFTYRAGAHSSSDDPGRYREAGETEDWKRRDPIERMKRFLQQTGLWSEAYEEQVWEDWRFRVNKAIAEAEALPQPPWESLFDNVYADLPPHLVAQRDDLMARESGLSLTNEGEFPL